jgi:hypothetical protein
MSVGKLNKVHLLDQEVEHVLIYTHTRKHISLRVNKDMHENLISYITEQN